MALRRLVLKQICQIACILSAA